MSRTVQGRLHESYSVAKSFSSALVGIAIHDGLLPGVDEPIVPGTWVDMTTRAADPCHEQYRYLWHINLPLRLGDADPSCAGFLQCDPTTFADLPASGFFAIGVYGQLILVLPSADIVIARVGQDDAGAEYWDRYARDLMQQVLDALK